MQQITEPHALRQFREQARARGERVAVVPTMGNLHDGHLSLLEKARAVADRVICTIFVNPAQFGPEEDIDSYPRTLDDDLEALRQMKVDAVFTPPVEAMYPPGDQTRVRVPQLSADHCGRSRPGHFDGVATVVCKLLNLVQADFAVFGQKDFQQLAVIRRMATDLFLPTDILSAPTRRAEDGLALSSRNSYLTTSERALAPMLYRLLTETRDRIRAGASNFRTLEDEANQQLAQAGWTPDYFSICHQNDLRSADTAEQPLVILAAARLSRARLIDNLTVDSSDAAHPG